MSKLDEDALISSPLQHNIDGINLSYYFVAMSGGISRLPPRRGVLRL